MRTQQLREALARNGEALRTASEDARRELFAQRQTIKAAMLGEPQGLGARNLEKQLAPRTRPGYDTPMNEIWADLPGFRGYEISSAGRVRAWRAKGGQLTPRFYQGSSRDGEMFYILDGREHSIDDLMRDAFGDETDEMDTDYEPQDSARTLTEYELREIQQAEGWKPAFEVAEEFRIDSARVRNIWDGRE